jgi:hypothetical protein
MYGIHGRDVLILGHTFTLLNNWSGVLITPDHDVEAENFHKALKIAMIMHKEFIFMLKCLRDGKNYLAIQGFSASWDEETKRYLLDWREQLKTDFKATKELYDDVQSKRSDKPQRNKQKGFIYLVKAITPDTHYKIGLSKDPVTRIDNMGIKLPFPIEPIHTFKTNDMHVIETYLHQKYANKRLNGEWFELSEQDVADICAVEVLNAEDIA